MDPFIIIEPFGIVAQNPDLLTEEERLDVLRNGWAEPAKIYGIEDRGEAAALDEETNVNHESNRPYENPARQDRGRGAGGHREGR
jgi:hypothetical protein